MKRKNRSRHTSKFSRQSSSRFEQLENRNLLAADFAGFPIADGEQIDIVAETSANSVNAQQLNQALESADEGLAADVGGASTSVDERVRLIVRLSEQDATDSVLQSVNADATNVRPMSHIPVVIMEVPESQIERVSETEGVVSVTRDYAQPHTLASAIPITRVDEVHARGITGGTSSPRPTVVVIDNGIDSSHPFFQGGSQGSRIINQACFSTPMNGDEESLCAPAPNVADVNIPVCNPFPFGNICDHGTHVAGIAAGNMNADPGNNTDQGVAPGADIIAIQAFTRFNDAIGDCNGTIFSAPCTKSYVSDQVAALDFVVGLSNNNQIWNIAAVNMSLGGGSHTTACDNDSTKPAIDALLANGVATVISAGNDSLTSGVAAPGCVSTAFTVGSTTDSDGVSGFSNRGELLDVFAPGSNIRSSVPGGYANFNGTSMAAPHVAGALALLRDAHPDRSITELMQDLENTGVPISYSSGGSTVVTPRIDVHAAMGTDLNDQLSEAESISIPFSENGTIDDNGNDVDMYQFTVSPGQIVGFDIDRTSGNLDSFLRLFNSNGNQIAAADDGVGATPEPSNVDSYLEYYFPTGGTYYIGVSHWQNQDYDAISGHDDDTGTTGGYSLHLTDLGGDSNRTIGQAEAQAIGNAPSRSLIPSVDVDMFSFAVAAGQTVQFDLTVTGGADLDSRLRLFDSSGTELRSVNGSGDDTLFEHTFPIAGTYYIGVSDAGNDNYDPVTGSGPHNDNINETGTYRLHLSDATPTILEVSSIGDASDGIHTHGNLTLREAIELANIDPDANEITFDTAGAFSTPQTILIGSPLPDVNSDLVISGPGADVVTIDAGGNTGRIFLLDNDTLEIDAEISGMTLTGADGSMNGGAILNRENLTLRHMVITGNVSLLGGGIYNGSNLRLIGSTVSGNVASGNGGGIYSFSSGGTNLQISDSTIFENDSSGNGGGVYSRGTATVLFNNSTVSGNHATGVGGGIRGASYSNFVTIENSTFANNSSDTRGGGVDVVNAGLTINNSIVAKNNAPTNPDVTTTSTAGSYNLIGNGTGLGDFTGGNIGNQIGVATPGIGDLADNGGPTLTHALLSGSPAINAGDPNAISHKAVVLSEGPSVLWEFEEASGSVVNDTTGSVNGSNNGAMLNQAGAFAGTGRAVDFDGFDDNIRASLTTSQLDGDTYSFSFWLEADNVTSRQTMVHLNANDGAVTAMLVDIQPDGTLRLLSQPDGPGGQELISNSTISSGWHHVAFVRDGDDMQIYLDGVLDNSRTGATGEILSNLDLFVGHLIPSVRQFDGRMDEMAVYNHALSAAAVADQFQSRQISEFDQRGEGFGRVVNHRIDIGAVEREQTLVCDFDGDSDCDIDDLNLLYIELGSMNNVFNLDGLGIVDNDDVSEWLALASAADPLGRTFIRGDVNLDGDVGGADFTTLAANFGAPGGWANGNFVVDPVSGGGTVGGSDFTALAANFGFVSNLVDSSASGSQYDAYFRTSVNQSRNDVDRQQDSASRLSDNVDRVFEEIS